MKIDLKKFQENLTTSQVIQIVRALGADEWDDSKDKYIIFPTICHNEHSSEGSMKLYYYKENKRFHCYTECGDTFNIFELVRRVWTLKNYKEGKFDFREILDFCLKTCNITDASELRVDDNKYVSQREKYERKQRSAELPIYSKDLLNLFTKYYPPEWLDEHIGTKAMDKFNIRYSISQNKIVIPHYNINGDLIGIRGRALNEEEIELYGKYMPIKLEETFYAHPLSQALYGLNFNKDYMAAAGKVILFEAEKSVLLYETYYENNISAAVCGSNFNKVQLELLLKYVKPTEIIICFDKEYTKAGAPDGQKYFQKLWDLCMKYSHYCHISFVFDREQLLKEKDSPIDRGKEVFEKLLSTRIKPWETIK